MKRLLLAAVFVANTVFADTILVRSDEWMPYNGDPKRGQPEGYTVEILREALEGAGHTVIYEVVSFERAIKSFESGEITCLANVALEAPDNPRTKNTVGFAATSLFISKQVSKKGWEFDDISSFDPLRKIGLPQGWTWTEEYGQYFKQNSNRVKEIAGANALDKAIKMLSVGSLDLYIEDRNVFESKAKQLKLINKVVFAGYPYKGFPMYASCSKSNKNSEAYLKLIDDKIVEMRKNGKLKVLLNKYGIKDWAP